jgi:hypothetical protein
MPTQVSITETDISHVAASGCDCDTGPALRNLHFSARWVCRSVPDKRHESAVVEKD